VTGNPAPAVTWLKNGVELAIDSSRYGVEAGNADEGLWTLVIHNCTQSDQAEYGCTAVSELGKLTSCSRLTVEAM